MRELASQGKRPLLDVVFTGLTREQALRVEARLIALFYARDPKQLLQRCFFRKDSPILLRNFGTASLNHNTPFLRLKSA